VSAERVGVVLLAFQPDEPSIVIGHGADVVVEAKA